MVWQGLADLLTSKTLYWFSRVANICWIGLGIILAAIFLDIEINEPRFDFRCGSNGDKELIRGKCYEQYEKQYIKFGIPVYGFVIINFFVTASVCGIYSQVMKPTVEKLERDKTQQGSNNLNGRKLFKAYCLQLLARFVLGISFVLLQTKLLYPLSFPWNFNCDLTKDGKFSDITVSRKETLTQTSYECHNRRAAKKTFWANAVIVVTGTFALLVLIESLYMFLWRARKVGFKAFTEDQEFHKCYLSSNQATSFNTFIEHMKEHVLRKTERPDRDPFGPNPGEGPQRNQTLDQIYTNLVIHEGRAAMHHLIPGENSQPTLPEDIFGAEKQKILVVGRPGIGKTMFSTKILRNWASDNLSREAQNFKVAFLVKLRKFNSAKQDETLSLRELLSHSDFSKEDLTEEVWKYILQNPNKVLIIFDGFDEYSGKTEIDNESHPYSRDNEQESMPVHILFKKIALGGFLRGATVLTTTRPNAVSFMRTSLHFDKTVEILGFTTKQVDEYVQKFTKGDDQKADTIKEYINSNLNLLSFCSIPVNCFIICSSFFQLLSSLLPITLTKIYSTAVKYFYRRHGHPSSVEDELTRLGKIAFDGIDNNGRPIFGSDEVDNLKSNCLVHRLPDNKDDPLEIKEQYCFLHPTIQQFLAAKYLVGLSPEELGNFVSNHIQDSAWKVMMQFVAGLLAEKEGRSTDIFRVLLPSETVTKEVVIKMNEDSEERTETLTCWPADKDKALVVTLFNCMYENEVKKSKSRSRNQEVQEKLVPISCNALNFSHCDLSPLDCLALVHALKSVKGIFDFDLSENNLQSLGCIEIAKLLPGKQYNQGFCELKTLNLGGNNITDKAVKHLSTALTHTNCKLNRLDLSCNKITKIGVEHLSTALERTNCKLNSLNLRNNEITETDKNRFKSMNINCKLEF